MKQKLLLTLSVAATLVLTGCGTKNNSGSSKTSDSSSSEEIPENTVTFNLPSMSDGAKEGGYDITVPYSDDYFKTSAKVYHKDLSMLSFGASMTTGSKNKVQSFYDDIDFDNFVACDEYDETPTETSVGYTLAHKTIDNADLFAVTIRGLEYGMEWANNTKIGSEGNHAGFEARVNKIYTALKGYVTEYASKEAKLWISGYSRGGGIANLLADKLLKENSFNVSAENMYVYTFEAPRGVDKENASNWENVHNIINSADLITYIAPDQYGLARCGQDIDIYNSDVTDLMKIFDNNIDVPEFAPWSGSYATDQEKATFLLGTLLTEGEEESSMATRELFVKNYQDDIGYALGIVFGISDDCKDEIIEAVKAKGTSEIMALLEDDNLYDFIKPFFDKYEFKYDDTKLKSACRTIQKGVNGPLMSIVLFAFLDTTKALPRAIAMHYTDTVYVLLKNYNSKIN